MAWYVVAGFFLVLVLLICAADNGPKPPDGDGWL